MRNANGIPFSALSSFTGSYEKKKRKKKKLDKRRDPVDGAAEAGGKSKEKRRNEECIGVCIGLAGIVLYTRTWPLISRILNILWDASGMK